MLSLFRNNNIALILLFIPYAFILRSFGFFKPVYNDFDNGGLLADWIYESISLNQMSSVVIAFILIISQAIFLNFVVNKHKLTGEDNLYVGLFYLLTASISIFNLGLTPSLIANTFLILALANLFETYREKEPSGHHFGAGFWLALASLSYGSLILFFLYGLIAMNIIRAFNIKEMAQLVSGYVVPYIILFTYYYFLGDATESFIPYLTSAYDIFDIREPLYKNIFASLAILVGLLTMIMINYWLIMDKQIMKARKNINIILLFILFGLISSFIQSGVWIEHFVVLAIPFSILLGIIFTKMKSTIWKEVLHLMLFLTIPICHYLLN